MVKTKYFDNETYRRIGSPDLNSIMYHVNQRTKKRRYGKVIEVHYLKDRVLIKLKLFKRKKQ